MEKHIKLIASIILIAVAIFCCEYTHTPYIMFALVGYTILFHYLLQKHNKKKFDRLQSDYETMFNHTSIGTQCYDADGTLLRINDAACKILGVDINKRQSFIDSKVNLFEIPYFQDIIDRNHPVETYTVIKDEPGKRNSRFLSEDGDKGTHYIETFITPVYDSNGHLSRIIVNNADMTEKNMLRHKVEEYAFQMKYILKASGVLTWTYDPKTHTSISIAENNNMSESLDWKDLIRNVAECDRNKVGMIFEKMDTHEMETFSVQVRFERTYVDASTAYYTIHGTPFRNENGEICYYMGLCINITQLINIQKKLEKEKEEALKADKLKAAFLASVSHEIRTPLNSIIGFTDILQNANNENEKEQYKKIISANNERLLTMIDDMLFLSKLESNIIELNHQAVDVEQVFIDTFEQFRGMMYGSNVKLLYNRHNTSCIITTDKEIFRQVLTNFMTNAVKYTKMGYIRMGYDCCSQGGVRIFVEDTGIGIPKEKQEAVFNRFEKLGSFVHGAGLGLSICSDIAKKLNGKIGVESEVNKGSTFWMWIPCKVKAIKMEYTDTEVS